MKPALCCLALCIAGCAYGGSRDRDRDAGRVQLFDGGQDRFDGGDVPGIDAGRVRFPDAGRFDAGRGFDAGRMTGCTESPCRLVSPQCGCAAGEGCYINASSDRACMPAGTDLEGEGCTADNSCAPGLLCLGVSPSTGVCGRFCASDSGCSGGALCIIQLDDGTGAPIPGVTLCTNACDPVYGDGCPLGIACTIYQETAAPMRYFTGCRPEGTGLAGDPCTNEEDCAGGHFCANSQCYQYCVDDFDCPGVELCEPFSPAVTIGGVSYGYCF